MNVCIGNLLSGSEMDRFCDERIRKRPNPESGRNPANNRLLTPGSYIWGTAVDVDVDAPTF